MKSSLKFVLALLAAALPVAAQTENVAGNRGFADISLQGYYLGGAQSLSDTSGVGIRFQNFIPSLGLLSGSYEGYGSNGRYQFGENYVQLSGLVLGGRRWNFIAGDFKTSASMVEFPFTNLVNPEISARGVKVEASGKNRQYSFFFGREMLLEGPRIPFHVAAPQTVLGLTFQQKLGERLQIGARFLRFSSSPESIDENPYLFPLNRQFTSVNSLALQSHYKWTDHLRLFGEATLSTAAKMEPGGVSPAPFSLLAGEVYETPKITARTNYTYQGAAYLPLIGQFAGDRAGPFGELRYRPFKSLEVYGSASRYRNNLENDPESPTFRSTGYSIGATATLPGRWNVSGQISKILFTGTPAKAYEDDPDNPQHERDSDNTQVSLTVSRPFGRHHLRMSLRDTKVLTLEQDSSLRPERERSAEIEDRVNWNHLSLGGAVRAQGSLGAQQRNNLLFRGLMEAHFRRFSANVQYESGGDLVNRSVFATSTYSSTIFGISTPAIKGWDFHLEAFRNRLNTGLNPESIFVLGGNGVGLTSSTFGFNQWSVFFRMTRQIAWGGPLPGSGADLQRYTAEQLQLTGAVEGFVEEVELAGTRRVEGIPVTLDQSRMAVTDVEGRYRFTGVPEGAHRVALSKLELPADFDPGPAPEYGVKVDPKRVSRADLNVVRLTEVKGRITGPAGVPLDEVLIRLEPGAGPLAVNVAPRYTTPDPEGYFYFYNLREGDYVVLVDPASLPADAYLSTADHLPLAVRNGKDQDPLEFEVKVQKTEKPVRKIFEQKIALDAQPEAAPKTTKPTPARSTEEGGGTPFPKREKEREKERK